MTIKQNGGVFGRNPTFNDVTIEGQLTFDGDIDINSDLKIEGDLVVDTDTLVVDATGNRVGIGTASPNASGSLHVLRSGPSIISSAIANSGAILESGTASVGFNLITPNNQAGYINFGDPEDSNAGRILYSHSSNSMQFGTNDSTIRATITSGGDLSLSSGNLVVASGQGIDFSATSGTGTSELFDDYEEGTWTPSVTAGAISGTNITYTGNYTKIGNTVTVWFLAANTAGDIQVSSYASLGTLPFTVASEGTGTVTTEDIDQFSRQGFANASGTTLFLSACGSATGTVKLFCSVTYKV